MSKTNLRARMHPAALFPRSAEAAIKEGFEYDILIIVTGVLKLMINIKWIISACWRRKVLSPGYRAE
jgi:hypothetical protein